MRPELQKKIDAAIRLLQTMSDSYGDVLEIAYSGGKDSDVILQLAKEAGINFRAIYKNTTIDPPGTIMHVKEMGVEIVQPKKYTFRQLIAKKGMPNRYSRFCCAELKEYKILDKVIIGVRREESRKRAGLYKEPTICRVYSKYERVEQIMPILEWTTQDVAEFIEDRKIKCAPVYYDEHGKFHPERRLGCMCCPLASTKKRIEEFKKYPGMVKLYIKAEQEFLDSHKDSTYARYHSGDAIECFVHDVFFPGSHKWYIVSNGMFGKPDFKGFLEKTFNILLK